MSIFLQNLRFGFRLMAKNPGGALLAVGCLAIGILLVVTAFSVTYGIAIRGFPYPNADRIVHISKYDPLADNDRDVSLDEYRYIREQQQSLEVLAAYHYDSMTYGYAGQPNLGSGYYMSADGFAMAGKAPLMGRYLNADDCQPGSPAVVVISYRAWKNAFGEDPDILGKTILTDGRPSAVVGVMPKGFEYPSPDVDLWVPLIPETVNEQSGWISSVNMLGVLREGVNIDQADAELDAIFKRRIDEMGNDTPAYTEMHTQVYFDLFINVQAKMLLGSMLGAAFMVLLIASGNVANLLLAQASARGKELAIRGALGAQRHTIVVQMVTESLALTLVGAALGLLGAWWVVDALWQLVVAKATYVPSFFEFRIDPPAVVVAIAAALIAGLAAGLPPALRASKADVNEVLKENVRTSTNLHVGLLNKLRTAGQLAASCALLIIAGVFILMVWGARNVQMPFKTDNILTAWVSVDAGRYPGHDRVAAFWGQLQQRLADTPGVEAISGQAMMDGIYSMELRAEFPGVAYPTPEDRPTLRSNIVLPGYFETMGVQLLEGRDFLPTDRLADEATAAARRAENGGEDPELIYPVIVNKPLADKYWPGESAVGRTFSAMLHSEKLFKLVVIGVAPDLWMAGAQNVENPETDFAGFYQCNGYAVWRDMQLMVRTSGDPAAFAPELRRAVAAFDADLAVTRMQPFSERWEEGLFWLNFLGWFFFAFGVAGFGMAAVGLYGIVAFGVNQSLPELAIRMAFGANGRSIVLLVLRRGIWQLGLGIGLGLLVAWSLGRVLAMGLNGSYPDAWWIYAGIACSLSLVAMLAYLLPARWATQADLLKHLRAE